MKIKQDPVTGLWCRSDGAVLMPPASSRFPRFRWTFGYKTPNGYRRVCHHRKHHFVHQMVCRAFNGLRPEGRFEVDHINRCPSDNRPENLRWVSHKENANNRGCVDESVAKYGVRSCEDRKAYDRARYETYYKRYLKSHCEEHNARQRAYAAAKRAKMKAQGLIWKKGPNNKWGWFPKVRKSGAV